MKEEIWNRGKGDVVKGIRGIQRKGDTSKEKRHMMEGEMSGRRRGHGEIRAREIWNEEEEGISWRDGDTGKRRGEEVGKEGNMERGKRKT